MKAASLVKFSSRTKSCTPTRSRAVKALSMVTRTPSLPRACGEPTRRYCQSLLVNACLLPRLQDVEGRGHLDTGYRTCLGHMAGSQDAGMQKRDHMGHKDSAHSPQENQGVHRTLNKGMGSRET